MIANGFKSDNFKNPIYTSYAARVDKESSEYKLHKLAEALNENISSTNPIPSESYYEIPYNSKANSIQKWHI